ncbi:hypothetical protein KBD87_00330 [Candidatus Saccharibacteria bacterium]|nr:hypothetical protein [Candidatus Saccharibacteria bacterium]
MTHERASKKQQELLSFVDGFIKGNGYGPSYREIMRALGYKSVSTVATHIDGLIVKGYLRRGVDNSARSLEVVTLREPAQVKAESQSVFEDELVEKIQALKLSDEQYQQVLAVLDILHMPDVAKKLHQNIEPS